MSVHWCEICSIHILVHASVPGLFVGEVLSSKKRNIKSVLLSCELNKGKGKVHPRTGHEGPEGE